MHTQHGIVATHTNTKGNPLLALVSFTSVLIAERQKETQQIASNCNIFLHLYQAKRFSLWLAP